MCVSFIAHQSYLQNGSNLHENMAVVIYKQLMVDVVVGGGSEANHAENRVPRRRKLGMDESQPVGVQ